MKVTWLQLGSREKKIIIWLCNLAVFIVINYANGVNKKPQAKEPKPDYFAGLEFENTDL